MIRALISWFIVAWICYVFLLSLPYKFSRHPDTQHIFNTIGEWMGGFVPALGDLFSAFGSYVVGAFELITCVVLLLPGFVMLTRRASGKSWRGIRARWHVVGGLMASAVMVGAVFFHLFTPLGIEVLHQGEPDGGSLFKAAVSILILGVVLAVINISASKTQTDPGGAGLVSPPE